MRFATGFDDWAINGVTNISNMRTILSSGFSNSAENCQNWVEKRGEAEFFNRVRGVWIPDKGPFRYTQSSPSRQISSAGSPLKMFSLYKTCIYAMYHVHDFHANYLCL